MRFLFCAKIFSIAIWFAACSGVKTFPSTPCIQSLQLEISNNWFYLKDSLYYKVNQDFLNRIKTNYKNCLLNLSSEQIISLFGNPNDTKGIKGSNRITALVYRVTPPCYYDKNLGSSQCIEFMFYLDQTGKVEDVNYIVILGISNH